MLCSNCGEDRKKFARGLCQSCYGALRKNGAIKKVNKPNHGQVCEVDGCGARTFAKGVCQTHYRKQDHPMKTSWKLLRIRAGAGQYPSTWDVFSKFLSDVGDRPTRKHQLRRPDINLPWSRTNFTWVGPASVNGINDPDYARAWNFKKNYGLTVADYEAMLLAQGGVCAICRRPESHRMKNGKLKSLSVDHDHAHRGTGIKCRGLLCVECNSGLGRFQDNPAIIRAAAAYLERTALAAVA